MLLVYGPHKSILPGAEEWNEAEKVLFGTFRRFLWGLVLAWVTYACHYGAGGLWNISVEKLIFFENRTAKSLYKEPSRYDVTSKQTQN